MHLCQYKFLYYVYHRLLPEEDIILILWFQLSPTYTVPDESTDTPTALLNIADTPTPSSYDSLPDPAIVDTTPDTIQQTNKQTNKQTKKTKYVLIH